MDEINDVGTTPATDNLRGKGFADDTRQLSWQLQVQSVKSILSSKRSLFQKLFII